MKKFAYIPLSLVLLLASCGGNVTPTVEATPSSGVVQIGSGYQEGDVIWPSAPNSSELLKPQINEGAVCYTYSQWNTNYGCTPNQRDLVDKAGYIYREVKPSLTTEQRRITIGTTYVRGTIVVTVNGGADSYTKSLVQKAAAAIRWGYLSAAGTDHAETALAKAFGPAADGSFRNIGISNPAGPCDACKSSLAPMPVNVTYFLNWYW